MSGSRPRIAVVGGGVSGLTVAYRLRRAMGADTTIDLYEAADRTGGVLRTEEVGGQEVDVGAEAFIVRRPEALGLITELGLADRVVAPTGRRPAVWAAGRLHDLPRPALMGIPASPSAIGDLADPDDVARIEGETNRPWRWTPGDEPSVGELVADRFGPSVVSRSVDPMLGGVYATPAADLGLREAIPALADRLDAGAPGLRAAVADLTDTAATGGDGAAVFGALLGGYRTLVDALADAAGARIHLGTTVTGVRRDGRRWTVALRDGRTESYDGIVLATPAWVAGHLIADDLPRIGVPLAEVRRAPSVIVSIALVPGTAVPDHSGVLVAGGEDLHAKAFTFSSQKWAHLADPGGPVSVRASFGRFRAPVPDEAEEPGVADRLTAEALADLDRVCEAAGVPAPSAAVLDVAVQPWRLGLPVYAPGHLRRMAEVDAARPDGLVLAGSAYAGVGVPACIGRAGRAAEQLLADFNR
ncbi:protoporphyrinogen oxidase [Gordonia sinesedis]